MEVTHKQLVEAGKVWLSRTCCLIITEMRCARVWETPDVLGFNRAGESFVIECKASRADFLKDGNKRCRQYAKVSMGFKRYYLCPEGMLTQSDVEPPWGLLWLCKSQWSKGYHVHVERPAEERHLEGADRLCVMGNEKKFLVAAAWRALDAQRLTRIITVSSNDIDSDDETEL